MNYLWVFENTQLLSVRIASREQGSLGRAAACLTSPQPHEARVPSPDLATLWRKPQGMGAPGQALFWALSGQDLLNPQDPSRQVSHEDTGSRSPVPGNTASEW